MCFSADENIGTGRGIGFTFLFTSITDVNIIRKYYNLFAVAAVLCIEKSVNHFEENWFQSSVLHCGSGPTFSLLSDR